MRKFTVLFMALLLAACGGAAPATTDGYVSQNDINTAVAETAAAQPVSQPQQPQVSGPSAATNNNANCRGGPDAAYEAVVVVDEGTAVTLIGRNTNYGNWWQVRLADGTECFIIDDSLAISGDTAGVPLVAAPPFPTAVPAPTWNGTWTMTINGSSSSVADCRITPTITQTGSTITTYFDCWDSHWILNGTVSADGYTATGTWAVGSAHWNFQWFMDPNRDQFRGKWWYSTDTSHDGYWCGGRNNAGLPTPCRP